MENERRYIVETYRKVRSEQHVFDTGTQVRKFLENFGITNPEDSVKIYEIQLEQEIKL